MARFWWTLRNIWHAPSWNHGKNLEFTFYQEWPEGSQLNSWDWGHAYRIYKLSPSYLRRDIINTLRWAYWSLLWLQPLRCNGNGGGWRTRVCDWLEDKARQAEN
jgi:hypothetical protein